MTTEPRAVMVHLDLSKAANELRTLGQGLIDAADRIDPRPRRDIESWLELMDRIVDLVGQGSPSTCPTIRPDTGRGRSDVADDILDAIDAAGLVVLAPGDVPPWMKQPIHRDGLDAAAIDTHYPNDCGWPSVPPQRGGAPAARAVSTGGPVAPRAHAVQQALLVGGRRGRRG